MSPTAASVLRMFVILGWVPPNILHRIIKGVQRNDAVIFTIFREGAYDRALHWGLLKYYVILKGSKMDHM